MGKKLIVVNAGPRKGWNTDTLLMEAAKGAESTGAVIERFDLSGGREERKAFMLYVYQIFFIHDDRLLILEFRVERVSQTVPQQIEA